MLVPQILLAGVIVKFDKLHYKFTSDLVVPVSGELMASRWAYEALAVNQFVNNAYQKPLFEIEKLESNINYDMQFLLPALVQETEDAMAMQEDGTRTQELTAKLRIIEHGLSNIRLTTPVPYSGLMDPDQFSVSGGNELVDWLNKYRSALRVHRDRLTREKDVLIDSLMHEAGGLDEYIQLKRSRYNEKLAQLVLNRNDLHKIIKKKDQLLRKMDPVFMDPFNRQGRAHFFASSKILGQKHVPTLYFNLGVIWIMTIILYVLLRYSILQKVVNFSGSRLKKRASEK